MKAGAVTLRTSAATVKVEPRAKGLVNVRAASPANIIIASVGRAGRDGKDGEKGPPGDGAADPGDLTVYFENALAG